ncbi:keratin, type II cytoskeletal I-like [Camellia sinensis]|uniref:keratin, type II cytoskeletal I-like n=1 Tax=Camellia sinensis TaxID=4442 RepID=UPI001035A0B6|nr:keratin, type II cytoskeletal I-like [Camellia sinensis]
MSEYENYALMPQLFIQAIQHAHSFLVQSFQNQEKLAEKKKEVSSLQKTNKNLQSKMKTLEDQAEAAIKAQNDTEENADFVEAIKKVLEVEKKDAEEKTAQTQKELQDALATKEAKVKVADEKGYNKEGEEVPKYTAPQKVISDVPIADKSLDQTLQEIDAELTAEKAAEMSSHDGSGGGGGGSGGDGGNGSGGMAVMVVVACDGSGGGGGGSGSGGDGGNGSGGMAVMVVVAW